jgi:hypothetical protein
VLPRRDFLTKEACGCRKEAKWSQSRVLPSAQLAYETGLSAGSIAKTVSDLVKFELVSWWATTNSLTRYSATEVKWIPHPELHRARTRVLHDLMADYLLIHGYNCGRPTSQTTASGRRLLAGSGHTRIIDGFHPGVLIAYEHEPN